jgi:glycosyltransferase involved in cell wall biosynthesis
VLRFLVLVESTAPAETELAVSAIRTHHPEADVTCLVCDPRPIAVVDVAGAIVRYAVGESIGEVRYVDLVVGLSRRAARWGVVPTVVGSLLADGGDDTVVLLPASAQLYGPLDDLIARSEGGPLLLPRHFDPASGAVSGGWVPEVGVFGPRSTPMIDWWRREAVRWVGRVDLTDDDRADPWHRFLDRSADLGVVGDGRFRVAPSTVGSLRLETADNRGVLVDGRPIVLADFPAFDPRKSWWYVEPGADRPDVLTSESPALRSLCRDRAAGLLAAGWVESTEVGISEQSGWSGGTALAREYRRAIADGGRDDRPANPYATGEVARYVSWAASVGKDSATRLSRAADDLWSRRSDLATVFPSVQHRDQARYARWMWTSALQEGETSVALLPDPPVPAPRRLNGGGPAPFGVNLVGYHDAELGLGVAVRRVALALEAAGVPYTKVGYDRTHSRRRGETFSTDAPYRFNLVLIVPDQLGFFAEDVGADFFADRYTIGLWYWETDVMTAGQRGAFGLVDEVWGATTYLADVFARYTDKPVRHVPIPLVFPATPARPDARRLLGFDDRFTFLFSFDFLSISTRKNPVGLLEAYRRAFPDGAGVRLIIKTINGDRFPEEKEQLADAVVDLPGVEFWDRYLDGDERLALVAAADCYVSLHRSEGLGLTMIEAMAAGTPVIATRYSGNLDVMDDDSALLVDCTEILVGPGHHYPPEGHWADPDLDQAADHMRRLRGDAALGERLAAAGRRRIARFGAAPIGVVTADRLRELWSDC